MELVLQIIVGVVCLLVATYGGVLVKKLGDYLRAKANAYEPLRALNIDDAAIAALEVGISNVMYEYAEAAKAAAENGKLSDEEKSEFKAMAIRQANALLGKGRNILAEYGMELIDLVIRLLVDRQSEGE